MAFNYQSKSIGFHASEDADVARKINRLEDSLIVPLKIKFNH